MIADRWQKIHTCIIHARMLLSTHADTHCVFRLKTAACRLFYGKPPIRACPLAMSLADGSIIALRGGEAHREQEKEGLQAKHV